MSVFECATRPKLFSCIFYALYRCFRPLKAGGYAKFFIQISTSVYMSLLQIGSDRTRNILLLDCWNHFSVLSLRLASRMGCNFLRSTYFPLDFMKCSFLSVMYIYNHFKLLAKGQSQQNKVHLDYVYRTNLFCRDFVRIL